MANRRKVQLTGTSTFIVSLPKDWAKRYSINKGSELSVTEASDGSLVLGFKEPGELEKAVVDIAEFKDPEDLRRRFLALYLAGFGEIKFVSGKMFPLDVKKVVVEEAKRLVGVEATEETGKSIVVQDFFSHEGLSIEKTLRRMHLITCWLYEEAIEAFVEGDKTRAEGLIGRDDDVDRLMFLLLRQLNLALKNTALMKQLGLSTSDCLNYATVVRSIENVADNLMKMARYTAQISGSKKEVSKKVAALDREAYGAYKLAVESFFKRDEKSANKVIEEKKRIRTKVEDLEKELLKDISPTFFQYGVILDKVKNVCTLSSEIAETAINCKAALPQ